MDLLHFGHLKFRSHDLLGEERKTKPWEEIF